MTTGKNSWAARLFDPKIQEAVSWFLLCGAVVGWPLSALTIAKGEPPFVLGLSWLALIVGSYNNLLTIYCAKGGK